jgi:hypothetical protein
VELLLHSLANLHIYKTHAVLVELLLHSLEAHRLTFVCTKSHTTPVMGNRAEQNR